MSGASSAFERLWPLAALALALASSLGFGCGVEIVGSGPPGGPVDSGYADARRDGPIDARSDADAGSPPDAASTDAAIVDCHSGPPLELGRCRRPDGSECDGTPDEMGEFVPALDGELFRIVSGPQGSSMIVFAARTTGILPGDPSRPFDSSNPEVQIRVHDEAGTELAFYRGRSPFLSEPGTGAFFNAGLFIIVEGAIPLGMLRADAKLKDSAGVERCGELLFTASR